MKTKGLLITTALLLATIVSSCIGETVPKEEFSRIEDLYGTEWVNKTSDGTAALGLKFYSGYRVTCFIDNQYGVETISGTYEYITSTKTISFNGLNWYYTDTGKLAMNINSAHITDSKTMKVTFRSEEGKVEYDYLYKQ